ncbi:MAG: hypothetical protein H7246_20505 [Phycisphaerae bacterium]|nr:hypothetical protein [Saprospiraceae bacterium]
MLRFYYLFHATLWLFLAFSRAAWHFKWRATRALDLPEGLVIGPKEKRRLKHYFYGTSYLAAIMCALRNQPRSGTEKYLFTNLSALAYSFDDLVDVFREDEGSSILWQNNPEAYGLVADKRGLALHLLHNIYRELPEKDLGQFRSYMHRVFNVETAGRQKVGIKRYWDIEILEKITAEKGGCSVLLFRTLLNHNLSMEEENAFFQLGYLIQCSDDIFDLWQDHQAGIVTLATFLAERAEIGQLLRIFEQQVVITHRAFRQTAYSPAQVETALHSIHFLVSITRVCLRHYVDLEHQYGALPLHDRTVIVVDMEIWANRFQAFRYLLRPLR